MSGAPTVARAIASSSSSDAMSPPGSGSLCVAARRCPARSRRAIVSITSAAIAR